jgi:mannosyltransferase
MNLRNSIAWVLAAVVACAVVADFVADQEGRPFWYDEVLTALLVESPSWEAMHRALESGAHHTPPGYFVVMQGWAAVFGDGTVSLRVPSLLCTLTGCWLLALVLRRQFGVWPGVLGACLGLTSSGVLLANLNEARPGAAWWLLQVAWLWVVTLPEPDRVGWLRWRVAGALLLAFSVPAVHYAGFVFTSLGAAALFGVALWNRAPGTARLALATCLGLAAFALTHADLAFVQQERNIYGDWIADPSPLGVASLYRAGSGLPWEVVVIAVAALVVGWGGLRGGALPRCVRLAPVVAVAVVWLAAPLVLVAVQAVGGPNLVYVRYTVPLDAAGAVVAAAVAAWALRVLARRGWARWAAVACLVVGALRVVLDPAVHAWAFRAYAVEELAAAGGTVFSTDVYMMYPLAWEVRDPSRTVLLARTDELAGRFRSVTPHVSSHAWTHPVPERRPGILVLTALRAQAFRPEAWVELNRFRVVGRGSTPDGIEVWRVEPLP